MASAGPRPQPPQGRIVSFYRLDVRVEARRLSAAAIDLLVLFVAQTWVNDVFGVTRAAPFAPWTPMGAGFIYFEGATTVGLPWLALLAVVIFSVPEALFGATWGKLAAGLRVIGTDGLRPGIAAVIVRNIVRLVDYWPALYLVGIISSALSPLRQRLGDRLAGTLVVRSSSAPLARRSASELRVRAAALGIFLALFTAFCFGFSYYGRPPLVVAGLVNTGALPGPYAHGILSYALGSADRHAGSVTYAITYEPAGVKTVCRGNITLSWQGFFGQDGGWRLRGGRIRCI